MTTTPDIIGRHIVKYIGVVSGSASPSKNTIRDMMSNIRNIFGREISESVKMMDRGRKLAVERMIDNAKSIDNHVNAVINMRITTAQIRAGSSEILAYGTAVVMESG